MLELVAHVEFPIVRGSGLPHFPDDFEPAVAQAAEGLSVAFSPLTHLAVVDLCPLAPAPA